MNFKPKTHTVDSDFLQSLSQKPVNYLNSFDVIRRDYRDENWRVALTPYDLQKLRWNGILAVMPAPTPMPQEFQGDFQHTRGSLGMSGNPKENVFFTDFKKLTTLYQFPTQCLVLKRILNALPNSTMQEATIQLVHMGVPKEH